MGNSQAADAASREAGPEAGQVYVLVTPDGERLDLAHVLVVLYEWMAAQSNDVLVAALAAACRAPPLNRMVEVVAVSTTTLKLLRRDGDSDAAIECRLAGVGARQRLFLVERLGYEVFSSTVGGGPLWTGDDYVKWSSAEVEGVVPLKHRLRVRPDALADPGLKQWFQGMLACHRRVAGPVGLFWLMPRESSECFDVPKNRGV